MIVIAPSAAAGPGACDIASDGATLTWAKDGSFDYEGNVGSAAAYQTSGLDETENRRGRHALVFP